MTSLFITLIYAFRILLELLHDDTVLLSTSGIITLNALVSIKNLTTSFHQNLKHAAHSPAHNALFTINE